MRRWLSLLLLGILPFLSKAQTTSPLLYNETNFVKQNEGPDPATSNELYAIWYRHVQDTTLVLKKSFEDAGYSKLISKAFYSENALSGPFYGYANGALTYQANYKFGKLDGEALTYNEGKITQRAYYTAGVKTGIWEEYNLDGKIIHKTTYDQKGHVAAEENIVPN